MKPKNLDDKNQNKIKLKKLSDELLEYVEPTKEELKITKNYADNLISRLKKTLPKDVEVILAGSTARGTQVKGSFDIDRFLLFPKILNEREMENKAVNLSKKIIDEKIGETYIIKYAEHPYIKLTNKRYKITADLVPAFKINNANEMGSAVDRTQLHNKFILSHLKPNQKNDVRLLKYFLKKHNIYGAEAKIHSFSGYECELLIYFYGNFYNVVKGLSEIKPNTVIDIKNNRFIEDETKDEYLKKFNSNFIIIDPTDSNRNVAASVYPESLAKIIFITRNLLENPTKDNFLNSNKNFKFNIDKVVNKFGLKIQLISMEVPDISEDTLWPQIAKLSDRIKAELIQYNFNPILTAVDIKNNIAIILLVFENNKLSVNIIKGPSIFINQGSKEFYKKHTKSGFVFIKDTNLYAIEKSKFLTPSEVIKFMIKEHKFVIPNSKKNAKISLLEFEELSKDYKKRIESMLKNKLL